MRPTCFHQLQRSNGCRVKPKSKRSSCRRRGIKRVFAQNADRRFRAFKWMGLYSLYRLEASIARLKPNPTPTYFSRAEQAGMNVWETFPARRVFPAEAFYRSDPKRPKSHANGVRGAAQTACTCAVQKAVSALGQKRTSSHFNSH